MSESLTDSQIEATELAAEELEPAAEELELAPQVLEAPAPVEKMQVARWYAVQVASSCEKKVKATLEQRAVTLGVDNRILEIEIPQTPGMKVKKDGSRQSTEEKVFPGYVLVRMVLDEDTMMAVRSTPNVINFVGAEERRATAKARGHIKPRPLSRGGCLQDLGRQPKRCGRRLSDFDWAVGQGRRHGAQERNGIN